MGQGQSRNLFEAAAADELERAKYFIDHDSVDVNGKDKVMILFEVYMTHLGHINAFSLVLC